jgi:hypothetical protein
MVEAELQMRTLYLLGKCRQLYAMSVLYHLLEVYSGLQDVMTVIRGQLAPICICLGGFIRRE